MIVTAGQIFASGRAGILEVGMHPEYIYGVIGPIPVWECLDARSTVPPGFAVSSPHN
jgi:hypothetical protein